MANESCLLGVHITLESNEAAQILDIICLVHLNFAIVVNVQHVTFKLFCLVILLMYALRISRKEERLGTLKR